MNTTTNSTIELYRHPDGFELSFKDGELIATDPDNGTVALPIGPAGLIRVGMLMAETGLALADATNGDGPDATNDRPALETRNNDLDFPTAARLDKDFSKLRTAFERHGHNLHRSHPTDGPVTFWAERWGLVRFLPTMDAARRFLEQIGGRL